MVSATTITGDGRAVSPADSVTADTLQGSRHLGAVTDRSKVSVLYALPGTAVTSYASVACLQDAGYRVRFDVGFYYTRPGWAERQTLLPPTLRKSLERELRRRHHADIDTSNLHLHPTLELMHLAGSRLGLGSSVTDAVLKARNRRFDNAMARTIHRDPPDVFIGQDTSCRDALAAARAAGSLGVLNQVIGHVTMGNQILEEEAALCPDFADSMPSSSSRAARNDLESYCTEEARRADLILAPSDYVRDSLLDIGCRAEAVEILPYGVDITKFSPSDRSADDKVRFLFVGQISQRKGIKYLLEAFKQLNLKNAELILVGRIIGSGSGLRAYQGLFRHIDHVPYSEVPGLFRDASVFVFPSLHEGSATVIYEALGSGLPVITTRNAGSVVRDGQEGYIVPIRDVETLKARMLSLYQDSELRRTMAQSARTRSESFTWRLHGERLARILDSRLTGDEPC